MKKVKKSGGKNITEVPTKKDPSRTRWDILLDVCKGAVRDAGIDKDDVHAVISPNPMAQPEARRGTRQAVQREALAGVVAVAPKVPTRRRKEQLWKK